MDYSKQTAKRGERGCWSLGIEGGIQEIGGMPREKGSCHVRMNMLSQGYCAKGGRGRRKEKRWPDRASSFWEGGGLAERGCSRDGTRTGPTELKRSRDHGNLYTELGTWKTQ